MIISVNAFELPPLLNFICYLLLVSSIFDFFVNIIPSKNPSYLYDGSAVYNDGNSFFKLLRQTKYPPTYFKAIELFHKKKYKRAIHNLHLVLEDGFQDKVIFNQLIETYVKDQQFERALNIYNTMLTQHKLSTLEYHNLAEVYWKLENYKKVILACNKVLNQNIKLNPSSTNPQTILLRGKAFLKLNHIDQSVEDFNQVITTNSRFFYLGYNYRGLAKIKLNQVPQAKSDLDIAVSYAPNDPFANLHFGIYFYKKNDFNQAMHYFQKAQTIDESIVEISHYIASTLPHLK